MRTLVVFLAGMVLVVGAAAVRSYDRDPVGGGADAVARASSVSWTARAAPAARLAGSGADVLTAHNDVQRLGWNRRETVLNARNVDQRSFGKRFTVRVDGQVYAQPLVVSGVDLPRLGRHDLLIVATEADRVYALDANSGAPLWIHTFGGCCGVAAPAAAAVGGPQCRTVAPLVGISSTPVVDRRRGTIYVVAKTVSRGDGGTAFHNTLHALDLATGADRDQPAEIAGRAELSWRGAFAPGHSLRHGAKRVVLGGGLRFDPRVHYNRPGLLLANGTVYIAFASHCDAPDAHGWVFAYDARDLHQVGSFVTVGDWNDVNGGGIWQSGLGLASDAGGRVYATTGNGPFDADRGGRDYGNSLLALTPRLDRVADYFTPYTQAELAENDADFGGGALIALPDGAGRYRHLAVASSKVRALFLLDRDDLGRFAPGGPDRVLQALGDDHSQTRWCIGTCGGPAYYAGAGGEFVYNAWAMDALRAYRLDRRGARPRLVEAGRSRNVFPGWGGTTPSVSSDGARPGTAIVWATTRPVAGARPAQPIELFAYDANDLSHELYRGDVSLWHNGDGVPFLTPTVANGQVYVGGDGSVSVFGLRPPPAVRP